MCGHPSDCRPEGDRDRVSAACSNFDQQTSSPPLSQSETPGIQRYVSWRKRKQTARTEPASTFDPAALFLYSKDPGR